MLDNIRHLIRHGRQAVESRANSETSNQSNNHDKLILGDNKEIDNKEIYHNNNNNLFEKPNTIDILNATNNLPEKQQEVESVNHARSNKHHHHHRQNQDTLIHPHDHHANELKPFAQNIVRQESIDENNRKIASRKSIERYKMGNVLGEGAFSVVYSAIDLITKEKVAIKIIKKYQLDEKQRESVLKEVNIMKLLNHPNIVKLIDFIENQNYYYIIQEVVSGGEIFNQVVKFTYFSEDLSRHVIVQVAEALLYMHEQVGIVHRDLKPENIFFKPIKLIKEDPKIKFSKLRKSDNPNTKLDEGKFIMNYGGGGIGLIKIGDFGLSKQISLNSDDSTLKTPCGTVGYTAPEIVRDMRYSKEVDMWALGCILYILLCGFPPFFNDSIEQLTKTIAKGEFKFLSPWWDEISSSAKHCVSKLLTVNPIHRYTVEQFLKDPWILEFLNRSENIQVHENLKKKVQQRKLNNNNIKETVSNSSNNSSSNSMNIPENNTTLTSNSSVSMNNNNNDNNENFVPQTMKRVPSGMPGFKLGADTSGNHDSNNNNNQVPLNLVYSQSVINVTKERSKMDIDINSDVNNDNNQSINESMIDDGYESSDESSDVSIGEFTNDHISSIPEPIPILEHLLEPAPVDEDLREDYNSKKGNNINSNNNNFKIENKIEMKKINKKKNKKLFTPEVKAMKDMFDISIAAHRMHEEAQFTPSLNTVVGFNDLNIVEENEDSNGVIHGGVTETKPTVNNNNNNNNNNGNNLFKLNLGDATILSRRQKRGKIGVV